MELKEHLDAIENYTTMAQISNEPSLFVMYSFSASDDDTQCLGHYGQANSDFITNALLNFLLSNPRVAVRIATAINDDKFKKELLKEIFLDMGKSGFLQDDDE